jgi:ankyrin repeat protein
MGHNKTLQPIHIAAKNGHLDIVEYILSSVPNHQETLIATSDEAHYLPIHFAAIKGHF